MPELLESYDHNKDIYDSYAMSLKSLLNTLIRDAGHSIHSLDSRVKTRTSLAEKIIKKGKYECIEDITDIVGVRIITHYSDDVDQVAKIIEKEFIIDKENSIDKRITIEPDRFGYLSLHYVVNLTNNRTKLTEYASYKTIKAEIQIRSILQHAWAEIEHDIGYKSVNGLPNEIKRYFSRLAGLLEIADDEFIKIKGSISARQQEVAKALENGSGEDSLDLVSLAEYLDKSKIIDQISKGFFEAYGLQIRNKSSKELENILNGLNLLDLKTIKQLDNYVAENQKDIVNRVKAFRPDYIPTFKSAGLPREILISFLMQIIVAKRNSPELEIQYSDKAKLKLPKDEVHIFFDQIRKVISKN